MSRVAVFILTLTALFAMMAIAYLWGYSDGALDTGVRCLMLGGGRV